jgi:hypothetical protein
LFVRLWAGTIEYLDLESLLVDKPDLLSDIVSKSVGFHHLRPSADELVYGTGRPTLDVSHTARQAVGYMSVPVTHRVKAHARAPAVDAPSCPGTKFPHGRSAA